MASQTSVIINSGNGSWSIRHAVITLTNDGVLLNVPFRITSLKFDSKYHNFHSTKYIINVVCKLLCAMLVLRCLIIFKWSNRRRNIAHIEICNVHKNKNNPWKWLQLFSRLRGVLYITKRHLKPTFHHRIVDVFPSGCYVSIRFLRGHQPPQFCVYFNLESCAMTPSQIKLILLGTGCVWTLLP